MNHFCAWYKAHTWFDDDKMHKSTKCIRVGLGQVRHGCLFMEQLNSRIVARYRKPVKGTVKVAEVMKLEACPTLA